MISGILGFIQGIMLSVGVPGVLFLAFIQELIPPIPSTLVVVSAGFIFLGDVAVSFESLMRLFWTVGLPVAVGLTLGSVIIYGLVYWGGRPFVDRYGKYLGVAWADIEGFQQHMRGHVMDDVLLFGARALPVVPSIAINVFCGIVRWSPVSFLLNTFFGTIIRAMWAGFIGWEFRALYDHYATIIENTQNTIFLVLLIAAGSFFYYRKHKQKKAAGV